MKESLMSDQENTTKTGADVAHFYRALGRAGADGMPMPFQVYQMPDNATMQLRYRTAEDVDAAAELVGGKAVHDTYTHHRADGVWHQYGTDNRGGLSGYWSGWRVEIWTAVDGPAPETAAESQEPANVEAEPKAVQS
jgi:hypothetical protein